MRKRLILTGFFFALLLVGCGGGGSSSGGGSVDLTKHQVLGVWRDTFDNTRITMRRDGTYHVYEIGLSSGNGKWSASSLTRFRMIDSGLYKEQGVVVSNNLVRFPKIPINSPSGTRSLTWVRVR